MHRLIGGAVAAVGFVLGSVAATSAQNAPTLYFSAIPDDDETRLMERFGNVAAYLSQELGVPVEYVPVKNYAASVTAFRNDQIQLGWFGASRAFRQGLPCRARRRWRRAMRT